MVHEITGALLCARRNEIPTHTHAWLGNAELEPVARTMIAPSCTNTKNGYPFSPTYMIKIQDINQNMIRARIKVAVACRWWSIRFARGYLQVCCDAACVCLGDLS